MAIFNAKRPISRQVESIPQEDFRFHTDGSVIGDKEDRKACGAGFVIMNSKDKMLDTGNKMVEGRDVNLELRAVTAAFRVLTSLQIFLQTSFYNS